MEGLAYSLQGACKGLAKRLQTFPCLTQAEGGCFLRFGRSPYPLLSLLEVEPLPSPVDPYPPLSLL